MDWHKDLGPLIGIKENEIGNTDTHVLKDSLFKTFEKGNMEAYDFFKLRDTAYINLTQNKWRERTHPRQIFWTFFVRAHSNGTISFWGTEEDKNDGFGENLYIIDANGENRKKIFNYPKGVYGSGPNMLEYDISEDGKWLLFSLDGDIVLIELEKPDNIINLTNSKDQIDIMPKFNFSDTKIVYSSGDGDYFNIFTMDFDGRNKQAHTTGKNSYKQSRYKLND
jgi:Tol biopolymer transport system component